MEEAQNELLREASCLLPRLAPAGRFLAPLDGVSGSRATYGMFTSRHADAPSGPGVPGGLVSAIVAQGWIVSGENGFEITDAGRAWLRRAAAASDPFRQQHQLRKETTRAVGGSRRPVVVNEGESPLGWLRRRKDKSGAPLINSHQFAAGERLRADFCRAQMMPRVTASWESAAPSRRARRASPQRNTLVSDDALAAKQRVTHALTAVGPELAGILIDVCCHLQGLSEAEQDHGWPQRSGKVVLQIALTALARHYGLIEEASIAAPVRHRLRHWGTDDFKPSLDAWR